MGRVLAAALACSASASAGDGSPGASTGRAVGGTVVLARGPYLQLGTPTGVEIRWRTDTPTDGRVLFGPAPGALGSSVVDLVATTEHAIALDGLVPGTRYYYAVGTTTEILAGADPSHTFVTAPVPGTPHPTRVWVLGDSGTGYGGQMLVRDAYYQWTGARPTDLWLLLGDNAYPAGSDESYQTNFFDVYPEMLRSAVVWPTLGNHDAYSADSTTESGPYYDIFRLPRSGEAGGLASGTEAYYSFDHANVHFVVLDSEDTDRSPGGAMMTWLDLDLGSTAQDWIVAFWHHPPYSKGSHDSDNEVELVEMRENALPILEAHGVDLVLTGHSHSYERSFLIDGHYGTSDTLVPSMLVDPGDGRESGDGPYRKPVLDTLPHEGAVQVVAGSSGLTSGGSLDHPAMFVSLNVLGSVVLDVTGNRLDATFLDAGGGVADSFTLLKGCVERGEFGSVDAASGSASYLYTPGQCDAGPPCASDLGTSITSSFRGSFWRLGGGDPAASSGLDNGTWPAVEPSGLGWVKFDPGQPSYLDGDWAFDRRADGCLEDQAGTSCLAILLADQFLATGYFSLLTAERGPQGEFRFDQPGSAPIVLEPMQRPFIGGSSKPNPYTVVIDTNPRDVPGAALHLDGPACSQGAVVGYKIYLQKTERDAPAPVDRTRDDGDPTTGWEIAPGGEGPGGAALPLGSPAQLTIHCYTVADVFLAATYVFESGFETPFVSRNSSRVFCGTCAVDDDQDGACGEVFGGLASVLDCDDQNPAIYPGAPQVCGDGANNDCSHPAWPSLTGTNEGDDDSDGFTECAGDCDDANASLWGIPSEAGNLRIASDRVTVSWDAPSFLGGTPQQVTDVLLRAAAPFDFDTATCIATHGRNRVATDTLAPQAGGLFSYLARAKTTCGAGTLGTRSDGIERTGVTCP